MRLPASEKLEIIGLVERSHLPARRTLRMLYRWYDRFRSGGPEALEDKPSKPDRVWRLSSQSSVNASWRLGAQVVWNCFGLLGDHAQ